MGSPLLCNALGGWGMVLILGISLHYTAVHHVHLPRFCCAIRKKRNVLPQRWVLGGVEQTEAHFIAHMWSPACFCGCVDEALHSAVWTNQIWFARSNAEAINVSTRQKPSSGGITAKQGRRTVCHFLFALPVAVMQYEAR